ncbi:uncharacterized protein [Drosophila kikkawai]|uniref:Uncharacterized protein n=1 Tax=Drosophila kikkawai TaxID=30033 RepID=A0A6P4IS25_DROKI|nr:uncharacterized protein LOC108080899 [Drosophila kikkawai]
MSPRSSSLHTNLVGLISRNHDLTSVFFFAPLLEKCRLEETLSSAFLQLPWVIWRSESTLILNEILGEGLLVLACLPGQRWRNALSNLSQNMRFLRQARLLIELDVGTNDLLAHQVLEFCQSQDMINTIAIFDDFAETQTVFSFESFPKFEMLRNFFTENTQVTSLYPYKMLNLHGSKIRTMPDYSEPNTILYKDKQGNKKILGYLWDMLEAYARKYNAQLQIVNKGVDERPLNLKEAFDFAKNGIIDVGASIQPMVMGRQNRFRELSYPVDLSSWCTMLPVERDLQVSELLARLLPLPTLLLLAVLWICYEALRGRWRHHKRLQNIGWLLMVTVLSSNYLGKLLSLLADPPSVAPIDSLAVMIESPIRIYFVSAEYTDLDFTKRTKYSAAFRLTTTSKDIIEMRNSLNTSFAYSVTSAKWKLYEEQQKRSSRPLFRYSTSPDLCFYEMFPFGLVIPENSVHRAPLHHTTLQLWQSGLYNLWMSRSFFYMVKAGKISFSNLRGLYQANTLSVMDLRKIFLMYGAGMLCSLTLFISEVIVGCVKLWLGFY